MLSILTLDVLIGEGFKINLPHGMNVYGNTASDVTVILCRRAIPQKSQILRNKHTLRVKEVFLYHYRVS